MPHKKGHKKTARRKVKKGGYYGAAGPIPGAPGAGMQWNAGSEMGGFSLSSRGGNAIYGSGRKRKMTRRKARRGGSKFGGVSASYQGQGTNGLINVSAVNTRGAPGQAAQGAFNNFGVQPGGGYGSFVKAA